MSEAKEFLNPNSIITPSAAGGLIVTISLPLATAFGWSVMPVALVMSFFLGALMVLSISDNMSRSLRSLYWILNSLIIFSVAIGIGISVNPPPKPPSTASTEIVEILKQLGVQVAPSVSLDSEFFDTRVAFAQPGPKPKPTPPAGTKANAETKTDRPSPQLTIEQTETLKKYLQEQREYQERQREYQRRWSW